MSTFIYDYKNLKVGDTIRILKRPMRWASALDKRYPLNTVKFPYELTIQNISKEDFTSMTCGNYGWCLRSIIVAGCELISRIEPSRITLDPTIEGFEFQKGDTFYTRFGKLRIVTNVDNNQIYYNFEEGGKHFRSLPLFKNDFKKGLYKNYSRINKNQNETIRTVNTEQRKPTAGTSCYASRTRQIATGIRPTGNETKASVKKSRIASTKISPNVIVG